MEYRTTRLVSVNTIATEMGWDFRITRIRLSRYRWLLKRLERGSRYDAQVIDILHRLFADAPRDSDPLALYLKEIE